VRLSTAEILKRYTVDENGCWLFTGMKWKDGYGMVSQGGYRTPAHRYFYEHLVGEFDVELYILHKCDNPICVNPDHLFPGTPKENSEDMVSKGRSLKGDKNPQYGKTGELSTCFGRTGNSHPMYGEHHTIESRLKISNTLTGKIRGPYKKKEQL
jgi:hypothetical protein